MKIKILYVGYSSNMGGIERFLINVCKNLDKSKFNISILIFEGKKVCCQDELEKQGIRFFEVTNRKKSYRQYLKDLKKIYSENNFDIIHFNITSFSLFERIILAKKYSKARMIVHSHSGKINKEYRRTQFLDKMGRIFTKNITYERLACGEIAGQSFFGKKDFTILNNGMELQKFKFSEENRNEIRNQLKIEPNIQVIGNVGRLSGQKNHRFLVEIFYEYQKLCENSRLVLVGEGELQQEIENQVLELNLQDKVLFLGKRSDTEKIYSAMDIFVMPSWFEGFSIAIVEAQVNGLKCYTSTNVDKESNVTGNVEFLSLDESAKNWAEKIHKEKNLRDKNVLNKVPDKFKIEETVKKLSEIYEGK